jgi:beta-phosphoglucomutase family hydrolase
VDVTSGQLWVAPPGTSALIFDCDGTLADTMPAHYLAWTSMLRDYGIAFTEQRFYELGGMPSDRIIELLARETDVAVDDIGAMVDRKEGLYLDAVDAIQRIEPVCRIAVDYHGVLPMAVASGGHRGVVERTLATIGLADHFGAIVCAEDTALHKPEPDVFLEAARRLGAAPATCVVFEDTELGLEAARRAGMTGVDVRPWVGARGVSQSGGGPPD